MDINRGIAEKHFMDWLRDAHAMEEQAETMLTATASRVAHYPDVKKRIQEHIEETREQARLLETCIRRRGGSTSAIKDLTGRMMAAGQGVAGMFASDEIVKAGLFSYAFEHFEIASYRNLIEAARILGDQETLAICERILLEEQAMADWLQHNMAGMTRVFLERSEQGGSHAKR